MSFEYMFAHANIILKGDPEAELRRIIDLKFGAFYQYIKGPSLNPQGLTGS